MPSALNRSGFLAGAGDRDRRRRWPGSSCSIPTSRALGSRVAVRSTSRVGARGWAW